MEGEHMNMKVSYNYQELRTCAEWISKNNPYINRTAEDIETTLYHYMQRVIENAYKALQENPEWEGSANMSSSGYIVQWQWEGEETASIQFLVDPSVGKRGKGIHVVEEDMDVMLEYLNDYKGDM